MRILLAEDDDFVRETMMDMLNAVGHEVVPAANGAEALRILLESGAAPFGLLFTDIKMPVMNGFELARQAAVLRPDLPILCMSGHRSDDIYGDPVIASTPLLEKPFRLEVLLAAIETCVATHQGGSQPRPKSPGC